MPAGISVRPDGLEAERRLDGEMGNDSMASQERGNKCGYETYWNILKHIETCWNLKHIGTWNILKYQMCGIRHEWFGINPTSSHSSAICRLEEMKCPGPLSSIPTCADCSVVRNSLSYWVASNMAQKLLNSREEWVNHQWIVIYKWI